MRTVFSSVFEKILPCLVMGRDYPVTCNHVNRDKVQLRCLGFNVNPAS